MASTIPEIAYYPGSSTIDSGDLAALVIGSAIGIAVDVV